MGILRSIRASGNPENPANPLTASLFEAFGGARTDAGIVVTEKRAMQLGTVYACVKVISEDLASMPFSIFEKRSDGSERESVDHPLYETIHDTPNDFHTSMVFRETLLVCTLVYGNGYALILRNRMNEVVGLRLLPPDRTESVIVDGKLWYVTTATIDGKPYPIPAKDILHIPALSFDGLTGISPIRNCMQTVGLAIAAEKFGAQFFGNGARSTGIFSHPGSLEPDAYENLKKSIQNWSTGDNALKPIVLEEGMKWDQITIPPEEAQFLETRRFQRSDIAGLYRVPLHLIQDLDRSTNNNIEHQDIEYARHTLRPLATRIEQEYNRKLLKKPFHCEHDLNDLQRGDWASQTAGYETLRNIGVFNSNDIRRRLRENPISKEEGGDVYLAPLNYTTLQNLAAGTPQLSKPGVSDEKVAAEQAFNVRRGRFAAPTRGKKKQTQ